MTGQYGPEQIAACYGVVIDPAAERVAFDRDMAERHGHGPTDLSDRHIVAAALAGQVSPEIKIDFPDWAPLTECAPTVAGRTDRVTGQPATVYTPPEDLR